jgi:CSLREA domain-containing protein
MRRACLSAIWIGSLIAMLVVATPALGAPVITVDTFDDSFAGSCTNGDCSLRDAVASVDAGGTVRLPPDRCRSDPSNSVFTCELPW